MQRRFAERGMTLPRFDVLAALDRHREDDDGRPVRSACSSPTATSPSSSRSWSATAWSRCASSPADRRSSIVRLTAEGRQHFDEPRRAPIRTGSTRWSAASISPSASGSIVALGVLKMSIARRSRKERRDEPRDLPARAFPVGLRRRRRDGHAEPARAEEPADLRILCRAARHCSARWSTRSDGQGGGRRRRRRQFQLGRRRPRDHRPADRDGRCPACSTSPG